MESQIYDLTSGEAEVFTYRDDAAERTVRAGFDRMPLLLSYTNTKGYKELLVAFDANGTDRGSAPPFPHASISCAYLRLRGLGMRGECDGARLCTRRLCACGAEIIGLSVCEGELLFLLPTRALSPSLHCLRDAFSLPH